MINIVCVKWGIRYNAEYVNRLNIMIKKNYQGEYKLNCCTEIPDGIDSDVNIIPLLIPLPDYDIEIWWWKLWIFSKEFPLKGKCLYFDLDIVIQNDITDLVNHPADELHIIKAQWRTKWYEALGNCTKTNSSVMLWNTDSIPDIFGEFISNMDLHLLMYCGDDHFLEQKVKNLKTLPIEWFYSRLAGFDDTDPDFKSMKWASERVIRTPELKYRLWRMPHKMICLMNGVHGEELPEDVRAKGYDNFSHYFLSD